VTSSGSVAPGVPTQTQPNLLVTTGTARMGPSGSTAITGSIASMPSQTPPTTTFTAPYGRTVDTRPFPLNDEVQSSPNHEMPIFVQP
jgi:hypothetical protein